MTKMFPPGAIGATSGSAARSSATARTTIAAPDWMSPADDTANATHGINAPS